MQRTLNIAGLLLIVLATASFDARKPLKVDWREYGAPLVIITKLANTEGCTYETCQRLTTINSVQLGLRSDGTVVWRNADLKQLVDRSTKRCAEQDGCEQGR